MAIAGAIKGSSTERLCQVLGLESLQNRRWFGKLSVFYKIVKEQFQNIYMTYSFEQHFIPNKK